MKNNFLLILTFFYCTLTWTQVKFEAEVSKNKLGVNENLRIDFKMNKDGDNFSPPNFEGFNQRVANQRSRLIFKDSTANLF